MKANGGFPNLSREERDRLERHTGRVLTHVTENDLGLIRAMHRAEMVLARNMSRERELRSKKKKKQP